MKFVQWDCGCIGMTAGWRKGEYTHYVLKPHELSDRRRPGIIEKLYFTTAAHVVDRPNVELTRDEQISLQDEIQQAFTNDMKYRYIKDALA